ncbi:MAG: MBL fold metallo-hydrolase [Treponema sp. CETP13]|nr:MAG: MBL fold metallo-hydrolase [Treponema sp. CETP13]
MKIKFWGVRGSIPTPLSPEQVQSKLNAVIQKVSVADLKNNETRQKFITSLSEKVYGTVGGNTPCVEITTKNKETIIIDCGSGLRVCGKKISSSNNKTYHIFLSHFHWDHIQGLPFFDPAFNPSVTLKFYSSFPNIKEVLNSQMKKPFFPVQMDTSFTKNIEYCTFAEDKKCLLVDGFSVMSKRMCHPGGSFSYSFNENGHKFIYASDVELKPDDFKKTEENIAFFDHADVLLFDAQYTLDEAIEKENWGHSSFCYAIDFAIIWNISKLYLFHHDPVYDDQKLYKILELSRWYADYASNNKLEVNLAIENREIEL